MKASELIEMLQKTIERSVCSNYNEALEKVQEAGQVHYENTIVQSVNKKLLRGKST